MKFGAIIDPDTCRQVGYRRMDRQGLITEDHWMPKFYGPTLTVYQDKSGKWRWRMTAHNGEIIATGHQSYSTRSNAQRAAKRFPGVAATAIYEGGNHA